MAESDERHGTGERDEARREEAHTDWDKISGKLLEHNFLLTALELYTESLEAGRELNLLKSFFSNPGNFEKSQQLPSGLRMYHYVCKFAFVLVSLRTCTCLRTDYSTCT